MDGWNGWKAKEWRSDTWKEKEEVGEGRKERRKDGEKKRTRGESEMAEMERRRKTTGSWIGPTTIKQIEGETLT